MTRPRLLWLAWDAADWRLLRPLLQQGALPHLQSLINRGTTGEMLADPPLLSQALWTTQASGVSPLLHGILEPQAMRPDRSGVWPIDRTHCRAPRVWDFLEASDRRSLIVNFPATHPVRPPLQERSQVGAIQVSNLFPIAERPDDRHDGLWPPSLSALLEPLRLSGDEIDDATLRAFIPELDNIDPRTDPRPALLANILAQVVTVHATSTALLESQPWNFAAVAAMGLHQVSHLFMAHHAPCHPSISAEDAHQYGNVVNEMARFHDMMLGRLLAIIGPDARILITSDHGFATGADRPPAPASNEHDLLAWHRPHGLALLAGPGIHHGTLTQPARPTDTALNILALMGLAPPSAPHWTGRLWHEAFNTQPLAPAAQVHWPAPPAPQMSAAEHYLRSLGYQDRPDPHARAIEQRLAADHDYYHALVLLTEGRPAEAIFLLEAARRRVPAHRHFVIALAQAYAAAGRWADCGDLLKQLHRHFPHSPLVAAAMGLYELARRRGRAALPWLEQAAQARDLPEPFRVQLAEALMRVGRPNAAAELLARSDPSAPPSPAHAAALAALALARGDADAAFTHATRAIQSETARVNPEYHRRLGEACLLRHDLPAALAAFRAATTADPLFTAAWRRISSIHTRLGQTADARDAANRAHLAHARRRSANRGLFSAGVGTVLQGLASDYRPSW